MLLYEAPLDTTPTPSNELSLESFQAAEHRLPGVEQPRRGMETRTLPISTSRPSPTHLFHCAIPL